MSIGDYRAGPQPGRGRSRVAPDSSRRDAEPAARLAALHRELHRKRQREREVVSAGRDVLMHDAPDWALDPARPWTCILAERIFYIQAAEDEAAAVYYQRTGLNPYAYQPGDDFPAASIYGGWPDSLARHSATDRNASRYAPAPASDARDVIVDEAQPACAHLGGVLSVAQLMARDDIEVVRHGDWDRGQLEVTGEELRIQAAALAAVICAGSAHANPGAVRLDRAEPLRAAPDQAAPAQGRAPARRWLAVVGAHRADSGVWYRVRTAGRTGWVPASGAQARQRPPLPDEAFCNRSRSRSLGTPANGRVSGAVLFPASGPDHFSWNFRAQRIGATSRTRWGTCATVRRVLVAIAAYRREHPRAPKVAVGDLGLRHGGEIDGHATHENGNQVDIYFPRRDGKLREPHTHRDVNNRLAGALVSHMLRVGAARVLVGPNTRIRVGGRVLRWPNHDDHLHVIFD